MNIATQTQVPTSNVKRTRVKTRKRTIYYYRAQPNNKLSAKSVTFESIVVSSWNQLASVKERAFSNNGKSLIGMDLSKRKITINGKLCDCHVLTLGVTEKGALANIINMSQGTSSSLTSGTHSAPQGSEFLDGESFICIHNNHILVSPCDALRGNISNKFMMIVLKSVKNADAKSFSVVQIANQKTLQTVLDEGVKRIDMNASIFMASYDRLKNSIKSNSFTAMVAKQFDGLAKTLMPQKTNAQIMDYESLNARLSFTHDMRVISQNARVEGDQIAKDAKELIQDHVEGFVLITKTGRKITPEKVIMNESVDVEMHGKSVKQEKMWDTLSSQMQRYHDNGVLDL